MSEVGRNSGQGPSFVPAFQVSALPWCTGSVEVTETPKRFRFPKLSKYVKVRAGGNIRVGFTHDGINGSNHFLITSGTVQEFDLRVSEIYCRTSSGTGSVDVFAGLTTATGYGPLTSSTAGEGSGFGWTGVG